MAKPTPVHTIGAEKRIGGFLPLRLPLGAANRSILDRWVSDYPHWLTHNARSALRMLWKLTRPRTVWLPSFVCLEAASAVPPEVTCAYYPVDALLRPDVDFIGNRVREGEHVLAVNYFGRPQEQSFLDLVRSRRDVAWIEDRAQAIDPDAEVWGDWLLYSPRKTFGVADGGVLVGVARPLPKCAIAPLRDFVFALAVIERYEDPDELDNTRWYASYRASEASLRCNDSAMSRMTRDILAATDPDADFSTRRSNYNQLHALLRKHALFGDSESGFVPLGMPIRTQSAEILVKRLASEHIFAARHWEHIPSNPADFPDAHRLSRELITLPCDQRYDEHDMKRIAEAVTRHMLA